MKLCPQPGTLGSLSDSVHHRVNRYNPQLRIPCWTLHLGLQLPRNNSQIDEREAYRD